jgi:hypothetical protein
MLYEALKETCLFYRTQFVPRSKHSPPRLYKTNLLMMYKANVAVFFSEIHTKHLNAMRTPCRIIAC